METACKISLINKLAPKVSDVKSLLAALRSGPCRQNLAILHYYDESAFDQHYLDKPSNINGHRKRPSSCNKEKSLYTHCPNDPELPMSVPPSHLNYQASRTTSIFLSFL